MSQSSVKTIPKRRVASAGESSFDVRQLGLHLEEVLGSATSEVEAIESLLQLALQLMRANMVLYFDADSTGQLSSYPTGQFPAVVAEPLLNQLYSLAVMTQETATVQIARVEQAGEVIAVAVPVFRSDQIKEVMLVVIDSSGDLQQRLTELVQVAQLVAAFAGQWRGRFVALKSGHEQSQWSRFSRAMVAAGEVERFDSAVSKLADGVQEFYQASCVAVGLRRSGGLVKLLAISNGLQFDRSSELTKRLEAVMAEVLVMNGDRTVAGEAVGRKTHALEELEKSLNVRSIYRATLRNGQGDLVGAFVVARDEPIAGEVQQGAELIERLLGHEVDLLNRSRPGVFAGARNRLHRLSSASKRGIITLGILAMLLLFVMPVPHRIIGRSEIQPVARRFVAAPYEGRLEAAFVEPGDVVEKGQTVARMDAREIRLERAAVEADLVRSMKQRDTSMANGDAVGTQMAEFEGDRLRLKLQLLQERMDHLEVKSPTDGMVISGDPRKLEGSRLRIGQTLVEVSPLGKNVLEVAIPDEDISHVKVGQEVAFRLEALPYSDFGGVIASLQPRSVQQDSANVFLAEVTIHGETEMLRPGMRGRAKIMAANRSLAWVLFHRAWENVFFRMGW